MKDRLLALILSLCLLASLMPTAATATFLEDESKIEEISDATLRDTVVTDEEAEKTTASDTEETQPTRVDSDEGIIDEPKVISDISDNMVIIPVGGENGAMSIMAASLGEVMLLNAEATVYIPRNTTSITIRDMALPNREYSSSARLQLVDASKNLIATTSGNNFSTYEADGNAIIGNETLYFVTNPSAGSYSFQVVDGTAADPVTTEVTSCSGLVVADPVVSGGSFYDTLRAGTSAIEAQIRFQNFSGKPEDFVLTIYDSEMKVVAKSTSHTSLGSSNNGEVYINYLLTPTASIIAGEEYSLGIERSSGTLYSSANSISTTADTEQTFSITSVEEDSAVTGGLIVRTENTSAEQQYELRIVDNSSELYKATMSPGADGVFSVVLTKNGLTLPLSAYGGISLDVYLSNDKNSAHGYLYIQGGNRYYSQYASLSLTESSSTRYTFTLTGHNMLRDIYDTSAVSFTLKQYDSAARKYVDVGTTSGTVSKSTTTKANEDSYVFSGVFSTSSALDSSEYYYLYYGNEYISGARPATGSGSGSGLAIMSYGTYYTEWNNDSQKYTFWFNFGEFPYKAQLSNSSGIAKAQLIDAHENVVAESGDTAGSYVSDGSYTYKFSIPYNSSITDGNTYRIRLVDGSKSCIANNSYVYTESVTLPTYFDSTGVIVEGDTSATLDVSMYNARNVSKSALEAILPSFTNVATSAVQNLAGFDIAVNNGSCTVTMRFSSAFQFGEYTYPYGTDYDYTRSIYVLSSETPSLGSLRSELSSSEIAGSYFENCSNLPEGSYTGILYNSTDNTMVRTVSLSKSEDGSTLDVTSSLSDLTSKKSYRIAAWCGNTFLGTGNFYVQYGEVSSNDDITFINAAYRKQTSSGGYSYENIKYITPSKEIMLSAYKSGYAYVRFAESGISSATYVPIRSDIDFTLSDGEGTKTVYTQFKKSSGAESEVYSYSCYLSEEESDECKIISAESNPASIIPKNTDFTITLVASTRLCNVYGTPLYNDDGTEKEYYSDYDFEYVGPCEDGYKFELTLNTSKFYSWYNWTGMRCYVEPLFNSSNKIYKDVSYRIGSLERVTFTNISDYSGEPTYTNQSSFMLSGYATANSTVTVSIGDSETVQATVGTDYKFSVALPSTLAEGAYHISARDSSGLRSGTYYLTLDKIAPVVSDLIASVGTSTNATVSWTCDDTDIAYYLLWRNNTAIKTASSNYTSKSYIDVGVTTVGTTYKLIAVDKAGNQSAAVTAVIGDEIPPTQPGAATMTSRATKHITFTWEESTDNFAVTKYYIYRDGEEIAIATISADADDFSPTYTDTGLTEGTEYTYTIKAADAAGNVSVASDEAKLRTATLTISTTTTLTETYYRQQLSDIALAVTAQKEDMYDTDGLTAAFQYKLKTASEWTKLPLPLTSSGSATYRATWNISEITVGLYDVKITVKDEDGTEKTLLENAITIKDDDVKPEITMSRPEASSTHGVTWKIVVSGKATDNIAVDHVVISRSTDGSNFTDLTTVSPSSAGPTYNYSFDWTPTGTSGSVVVRATAYDKCNNSAYAEQTITVDADAPDDVTDFAVVGTSRYIHLTWKYGTLTSESDFSAFRIYRAENESGPFTKIAEQRSIGYYDNGKTASADTTYYYYITAIDKYDNESSGSSVISGMLASDTESPTIGDMRPTADAELCKSTTLYVTAADNYRLSKAVFEYKLSTSGDWTEIGTITVSSATNNTTFSCPWDISSLATGTYQVRVSVYDDSINDVNENEGYGSNAPAVITRSYSIKAYFAPVAPVLTVVNSYKTGTLSWTYSGDASLLNYYRVSRSGSVDGTYSTIKTIAGGTTQYQAELPIGTPYYYKVTAVDKYGAIAESNVVQAESTGTDSENPVAVISPETLLVAKGSAFQFSGVNSTDNDVIVSYSWNFGDGATSTLSKPTHTYSSAGSFSVSLTVTDETGNSNTVQRTIEVVDVAAEDCEYTLVTFNVVDASKADTPPVPGAALYITYGTTGFDVTTSECDENGTVTLLMPRGEHVVSVTASSYMPTAKNVKVTEGENGTMTATIGLSATSLVSGELTATEMTYDEIVAAGIDVDNPDNQHVWKFATVLHFTVGLKTFDLPVTAGYRNDAGTFWNGDGGWFTLGGSGGFGGGSYMGTIGVFPMLTEGFYLIIYGEAHWLKEMYNVELLVINDSNVDVIENCVAELDLPNGLSLVATLGTQQTPVIDMGTIGKASEKTARWYVRGDDEGEYYISANVNGDLVSGNVSEPFAYTFTTSKPVKVYAGSALKLTVTADDIAERGKDYKVVFRLSNVSDKSLYNLSFGITGIEQGKILSLTTNDGEKSATLPVESEEFEDSLMQEVPELAPGGYIEIAVTTTCWFNSAAEIAEAASKIALKYFTGTSIFGQFIDVAYYLDSVSVVAMEGSTTSVPYEIVINRVKRDNLIDKVIFGLANDLFGDLLPSGGDLGGTIIEYIGTDCELDSTMISGAKSFLMLQQGETDYTFTISIDDGKSDGNSIYNDYISITTGTNTQGIIDTLNGTKWTIKNGEISFQAKGPGSTKIKIGVEDSIGNLEREYTINLNVFDTTMKSSLTLTPSSVEGEYKVNENTFSATLETRTEEDKSAFLENPFLWFGSEIALDIEGTTANSNYSVEITGDNFNDILDKSVTTKLTYNGKLAQISFDRAALKTISDSIDKNSSDTVTVSARRLSDTDAQALGSSQPTYQLVVKNSDGDIVSDFGDGIVFVSLPFELENDEDVAIEHIKEDGTIEMIECIYDPTTNRVEFSTNGFSYFRIREFDGEILTTLPVITGSPNAVGASLIASVSGVEDDELVYNWYRGNDFDTPISTGNTYSLTYDDSNTTLTVRASGTASGKYDSSFYTEKTIAIGKLPISGKVSISSSQPSVEGCVLSVDLSKIEPTLSAGELVYQWIGGNGTSNLPTYTVTAKDVSDEVDVRVNVSVGSDSPYSGSVTSDVIQIRKLPLTISESPSFSPIFANDTANATEASLLTAVQSGNAKLAASYQGGYTTVDVTWKKVTGEWSATGGTYVFAGTAAPSDPEKFSYSGSTISLEVKVNPVYGFITQSLSDNTLVYTAEQSASSFGLYSTVDIFYNSAADGNGTALNPGAQFTSNVAVTWTPAVTELAMTAGSEKTFSIVSGLPAWATFQDVDRKVVITDKYPVNIRLDIPVVSVSYGDSLAQPSVSQIEKDGNGTDANGTVNYLYTGIGNTQYNSTVPPTEVGTYQLTATLVSDTHSGSNSCNFTIFPRPITVTVDAVSRKYGEDNPTFTVVITDGTLAGSDVVDDLGLGLNTIAAKTSAPGNYDVVGDGAYNSHYDVTIVGAGKLTITKANAPTVNTQNVTQKCSLSSEQRRSIYGLMPTDAGTITYKKGIAATTGSVEVDSWNISVDGIVSFTLANGAAGNVVTLPVTITTTNYEDMLVSIVVTLTEKNVPDVSASDINITYTGNAISRDEIKGTATFEGTTVNGSWDFVSGQNLVEVKQSGTKAVVFTPEDTTNYAIVEVTITVTINKAVPNGTAAYQTVSSAGKTLADAKLSIGSLKPEGTIQWVDDDGYILAADTEIIANTSYRWMFTPVDTGNYSFKTGEVVLYTVYPVSPDSPSGSSSNPASDIDSISVDKAENGSVTVSPKNASKGDTVTITAKPDSGYVLDDLIVTDKNGNELKLIDKGNGKYTFIMPSGKVEVKVSFARDVEASPFADVATDGYYYEAVKWAVKNGITDGVGNNLFAPGQLCTRAQIVTFLWRAAGSPASKSENSFSDVDTGSYYAKAVAWATENGITGGTGDGKFSPDDTCTRAQAVTFLARALNATAENKAKFRDVPTNAYYAVAVAWAAENGVTEGIGGGLFDPSGSCTRAQIVTFLWRSMVK